MAAFWESEGTASIFRERKTGVQRLSLRPVTQDISRREIADWVYSMLKKMGFTPKKSVVGRDIRVVLDRRREQKRFLRNIRGLVISRKRKQSVREAVKFLGEKARIRAIRGGRRRLDPSEEDFEP